MDKSSTMDFVMTLPRRLKIELTVIIHHNTMIKIDYFKDKDKQFIAFIGPLIDPYIFKEDEFIYKEGEDIEKINFICRGVAGYVLTDNDNIIFATVENGDMFGHLDYFDGLQKKIDTDTEVVRQFSVMALSGHCEMFGLNVSELE